MVIRSCGLVVERHDTGLGKLREDVPPRAARVAVAARLPVLALGTVAPPRVRPALEPRAVKGTRQALDF